MTNARSAKALGEAGRIVAANVRHIRERSGLTCGAGSNT